MFRDVVASQVQRFRFADGTRAAIHLSKFGVAKVLLGWMVQISSAPHVVATRQQVEPIRVTDLVPQLVAKVSESYSHDEYLTT